MTFGRLAVAVLAGALAVGGAVAALGDDPQPTAVKAIDLNADDGALRRDDAADDTAAVDDNTGDGDGTKGNDGTGGGDNTHSRGSADTDDGDSGGGTSGGGGTTG